MNPLSNIFKNPAYQHVFEADGVVKIPFLDPGQLKKLLSELSGLQAAGYINPGDKYHVTLLSSNTDYKERVASLLRPVFEKFQADLLHDHRVITTNLIIKHPHSGEVPMHQNWSFVDEQQYTSLTIWCPLQDVDENNGALYFLKGSHRCFRDIYRGHQVPYFFIRYENEIRPLFEPVFLKAGEALIFDDSILHYSSKNETSSNRVAIQGNIIPRQVPVFYFEYQKGFLRGTVKRYQILDEHLLQEMRWEQIKREASAESLPFIKLNLHQFEERLNSPYA